LVYEWRQRYPSLFDERDTEVLKTEHQRRYNFLEWLAAVLIYESTGLRSWVAKYTARSHSSKHDALRRCLPPDLADWVFKNEAGQPDLFVYSDDYKSWYFCEVKGPRDQMRANQIAWRGEFLRRVDALKLDRTPRYRVLSLVNIDI